MARCYSCVQTVITDELKLPPQFNADFYTALRNRSNLIFVTIEMFETFRVFEKIIQKHFEPIGQMYREDSFHTCISSLSKAHVIPLFCDVHRFPLFNKRIRVNSISFRIKFLKEVLLCEASANVKKNKKLAKLAQFKKMVPICFYFDMICRLRCNWSSSRSTLNRGILHYPSFFFPAASMTSPPSMFAYGIFPDASIDSKYFCIYQQFYKWHKPNLIFCHFLLPESIAK